jgi:gliding motility-associated-like protein
LAPQTNGNIISYLWQDGSTTATYTVTQSGLYWVEARTSGNGCIKRDSVNIIYKQAAVAHLGNDTTICERTTLLLDAGNPGSLYTWQDNSHGQTFVVRRAGVYHVKIKVGDCESSDTIVVQIKNIPRVYLGNDTAICNGMTINLTPILNHANNAGFLWNTGEITPTISVTSPGFYSLEVQNICGIAADGIIVKPGVCQLYVPTAFSPNNDGKNDIFKPGYGENVVSYSMEIYNRWGEKVFASNHIQKGWNGKFNSVLQPAGAFAWFIRYKVFNDPKEYTLKGTVILVY